MEGSRLSGTPKFTASTEDRLSGYEFPSEEELKAGGGDIRLLPEDTYIARIESIEVLKDQTSQYQPEKHEEWKVRFDLLSFSNKDSIYYEDGTEPDPSKEVRLSTFINPTRFGMTPRPAKARKFVAAALGLEVSDRLAIDSPQELVGKTLQIITIHKNDKDGNLRDRIDDFRAMPKRSRPAAEAAKPSNEEVNANAESLLAAAKEVFGADVAEAPKAKTSGALDDDELRF